MAQLVSVKLSRFDAAPWGFRLQGGKDFAQPLVIQKVNGNSPAEKAGLQAGDALIRVNSEDLFNLSHKDAQNALVRAGNNFELTVQRGGSTWKPSVTPVGPAPTVNTPSVQPVTKTSLAYKQAPAPAIGAQHNTAAKPFAPGANQVNGETAKNLASKLYNSPVGLYSEETIAETLSAQTEVLAGGVLGVNFKKNEKTYNAANSEVLKMVQEIDSEPREPEPAWSAVAPQSSAPTTPKAMPVSNPIAGLRHVAPPEPKPEPTQDPLKVLPPGQNICADCERLIVGLFVRIKDKNLHVECFKCATCGTSLKNVGYYNINNKLYCDVHAKLVARQNPPAPNMEPVTLPPGIKPPSSIIGSALSSAPYQPGPAPTPLQPFQSAPAPTPLQPFQSSLPSIPSVPSPGSPLPGTLAPLPFHAPQSGIRHVSAPRSAQYHPQAPPSSIPAATIQAPKLNFGQPAAPTSAPRPLSDTQVDAGIQYQSYSTVSQSSYASASASQSVSYGASTESSSYSSSEMSQSQTHKKMSLCSQEVDTLHMDTQNVVKQLSEILEDQERCPSPTPIDEAVKRAAQGSKISREEGIQKIEQQEQWRNYQSKIVNKNLTIEGTGLAFLRSHSTPVAELEALYEQQQREIDEQQSIIQKLGHQKRMSIDETQIKQLESQIMESQNEIAQRQKRQQEIEKKKRVRFEEEEEIRRGSLQVEEAELQKLQEDERNREAERKHEEERQRLKEEERVRNEQQQKQLQDGKRREVDEQKQAEEIRKRQEEKRRRDEEDHRHMLSVEANRERARTPVADLEAYERHDGMSRKTETIYHTYEHLVQEECEEGDMSAVKEAPSTPLRAVSPYPVSIQSAEHSLLLKNIQGLQFEFELNSHTKPEPKIFKLPDLRNLGKTKPYAPPRQATEPAPASSQPAPVQPELWVPPAPAPVQVVQDQVAPKPVVSAPVVVVPPPPPQQHYVEEVPQLSSKQVQNQQEKSQQQQIKEQRKQVHEELALNERFRKKQERLGVEQQRFERAKTPVAEFEEEERHKEESERTHHVYDSYDQVLQTAERPRSRVGQPVPENQSITDAEKSLFFQNISGINYEFENISELTASKHQSVEQKSVFIRDVEQRTQSPMTVGINDFSKKPGPAWTPKPDPYQSQFVQALTTMPDPAATATRKTYEQFRSEQESLFVKQKQEQQKYFEQQKLLQGMGSNKPAPSPLVAALTIAPERSYSPLPTLPTPAPPIISSVSAPVQTAPAPQPVQFEPQQQAPPLQEIPAEPLTATSIPESPQYDGSRRRSSGFPGVNVQRTPYQMLRGSQIQSSFIEDLVTQQSAISQFMSETEQSSTTAVHRKDTIDASFGLLPASSQIAYAPPPPPDKRAELVASQAQFGSAVEIKQQKSQTESKPLQKPISLVEALTIAPENSYCSFAEAQKPQATLVHGGANVALTKNVEIAQKAVAAAVPPPPTIQIKPNYEVRDVQLNKSSVQGDYTGFVEERKEKSAEGGVIEGQGITGSYQKQEQKSSSVVQLEKLQLSAPALTPIIEQDTPKTAEPVTGFPPISDQLKAEFSEMKQSESSQQSSLQTEQVEVVGNVTKTTKRRVVEVAESSHKELTQVRVIGSGVDPVSGLRRTSNEMVSKASSAASYQSLSSSGLQKATSIPTYQNLISAKPMEPAPAVPGAKIDAKDFKPRPRSAVGGRVAAPTPEPTKVPLAFRSRTPVPLPKVDYPQKTQLESMDVSRKNLLTYNQDQVFRSASPRPISVPKAQFGTYTGPQPQHSSLKPAATVFRTTSPAPVPKLTSQYRPNQPQQSSLKPAAPAVYRSTSPLPVPKMVKTSETYQQPISSWRVQPVKSEKRVSWPPVDDSVVQPSETPVVTTQSSVKTKISLQEEQTQKNVEESRRSSYPSSRSSIDLQNAQPVVAPKSVKAMISQQEQQAQINIEEARRTSLIKTIDQDRKSSVGGAATPRTSLASKGSSSVPGPKHDPIVAPRPFGTPTPQRKIATPHFQPITPVAITEGQNAPITAPKLSFSSSQASTTNTVERKTSLTLTSSSASAFKPLDTVMPVKPVAYRPAPAPVPAPAPAPAPAPVKPQPPSSTPRASLDNGAGAGPGVGGSRGAAGVSAPKRGRGVLNPPSTVRIPLCAQCNGQVRGPFITALGKIWCPDHFICATPQCRRPLADIGFVEEQNQLHCEFCFEKYIAPNCDKCSSKIKGDCLNAIGKHFHPECFTCAYCGKLFGNSAFFLEDGLPYCENDWNELFTTKCFACGFPIEAGDRWVEALNNNYHSQCFNCTVCKKNLEGQSFFAKGGRPFCKAHAR